MLSLNWTAFGQHAIQTDTLRQYCMPIWQTWRMVRELQTLDRTAILLDSSLVVIKLKNIALKSSELTQAALDSAYQAKDNETKELRKAITASDALHESQIKTEKKKGNKKGLAGVIVGALIVLIFL